MNTKLEELPPLSLYIHVPWCIKKCPYCDFNSHELKSDIPEAKYIKSLILDLEHALPQIWGRTVYSIFIGGGTPSLFSADAISDLLSQVRTRVNLAAFAEVTLEVNPGTVEFKYIKQYKTAGINRISLGIQSFDDVHLKRLGRIHNGAEASLAVETVSEVFDNFNLDLIYGLPYQSIDEVVSDLSVAISYNPTHISAYNLTIEPNTLFYKQVPRGLPENDLCFFMQNTITSYLNKHNYLRYEISAYSKPGYNSMHNLNYWKFGDYLGIGAGAHSKLSFHDEIIRQARFKHPKAYMDSVLTNEHIQTNNIINQKDLILEFMMNSLRLSNGFIPEQFTRTTGLSLNSILPTLLMLQEQGLVELSLNLIKATVKGQDFLNNLLEAFIPK